MKVSDKIDCILNTVFAKKDYKFIKDTDHSDFPGPGFHRTETGWSNREETTEVGKKYKNNRKNDSYEDKEKPIIKKLDELKEDSIIIEGVLDGMYFSVLGNLDVNAIDEKTKLKIFNEINDFIEEKNIDNIFPLQRKEYIELIKDLITTGCQIQKIYLV